MYIRGDIIGDDSAALRLIRSVWSLKRIDDVIIVGAGPAGATLAYELARKGIAVLLLEEERLPRYKCCAGGVTSKAARLLDFDISEIAEDEIHRASFSFNLGSPYLGQYDRPLIYTVMRDVFDYSLVMRARRLGADLIDGQKVKRIDARADCIEVSGADNTFRSRLVVGADGAYSVVARDLDMGKGIEYLVGIESEIIVAEEKLAEWRSRILIDLGYIPGGYAWVFPKRDHLSVGVGCQASKARELRRRHQRFLDSLGLGSYTITRSSSQLIPTRTRGRLVWQNEALLVGDAAGLADPLTGEGIHNAIKSAQLAAPAIERRLLDGKDGLRDYQEAVDSEIISELRLAHTVSKFFVRSPHLVFGMLNQGNELWRALCDLMLGETNYAALKERMGSYRGIFSRLFRA
jgi:geranylgeranyl reductase family protein